MLAARNRADGVDDGDDAGPDWPRDFGKWCAELLEVQGLWCEEISVILVVQAERKKPKGIVGQTYSGICAWDIVCRNTKCEEDGAELAKLIQGRETSDDESADARVPKGRRPVDIISEAGPQANAHELDQQLPQSHSGSGHEACAPTRRLFRIVDEKVGRGGDPA